MALTTRSTDMQKRQVAPRAALLALMTLIAVFLAAPAQAAFHLAVIQEVFVGPPSDGVLRPVPLTADQKAQYVMMRMTSSGQTLLNGTSLRVEDVNGAVLGTFGTFTATLGNSGAGCSFPTCPAFIIGTQAAKNLFTFTFDKIVDGQAGRVALPPAGGRVCFISGTQVVDCLAWGSFNCTVAGTCAGANTLRTGDVTANACDTNWGTPAPALAYGTVLEHAATFNCAAKTNSTDYTKVFPKPSNNAGTNNNTDTDTDGLIDQLDCNDASSSFLWPPTEVQNERVLNAFPGLIAWESQAPTAGVGVVYDVFKGTLSHLVGFTDGSCIVMDAASAGATDGTTPPAGGGFYYVERAEGCTAGTWGSGFAPATSRDPVLNAACP